MCSWRLFFVSQFVAFCVLILVYEYGYCKFAVLLLCALFILFIYLDLYYKYIRSYYYYSISITISTLNHVYILLNWL